MLEFNAGAFYRVVSIMRRAHGLFEAEKEGSQFHASKPVTDMSRSSLRARLDEIIISLEILNARMTKITCERIKRLTEQEAFSYGDLIKEMEELDSRLRDELGLHKLFVLEDTKSKYFMPAQPLFGDDVAGKFISAAFELDEAAKCLAFNRPTASVFHLMRLMEMGVLSVARCLGCSDPLPGDRSWGKVLKGVRERIDAKWPTAATRASGDGQIFDELYASLDAVKNPWRNSTMHPANKYTDEEAEHVFYAVRGFMMKLASRCDENGDPKV
jgi:hypothetical protein